MNKFAIAALVSVVLVETSALVGGAYYALKMKKQVDVEIANTKSEVNKTVHRFAAVLAEFQV